MYERARTSLWILAGVLMAIGTISISALLLFGPIGLGAAFAFDVLVIFLANYLATRRGWNL